VFLRLENAGRHCSGLIGIGDFISMLAMPV